ncbi:MAG: N-acetylmuramoyl-L-alanine amidase [Tannerella sp.]|jgi:N-acetylmuramoyl-L-alanine amidase|nr:N-acetylmuramoyl-L-alanine amidase [Tannerella sp.]
MNKKGRIILPLSALLFLWASTVLPAKEKAFTVVIDAGHGGKDPGSVGSRVKEKTINLAVALKLGALIKTGHKDVNVIYTRESDRFVELNERANIANRNKADLFISVHANSMKKGHQKVRGTETYTLGLAQTEENLNVAMLENSVILMEDNYKQRYGGFDPNSSESYIIFEFVQNKHLEQSISFASEIQRSFSSAKRVNRGVRQAGFLVLRATNMASVLIELGFISNPDEERFMRSNDGQNQLARSIYDAFSKYKKEQDMKKGLYSQPGDVRVADLPPAESRPGPDTAQQPVQSKPDTRPARQPVRSKPEPAATSGTPDAQTGQVVYKIQILLSDRKLPAGSPRLKGYKADCYVEGNVYKYTYGASADQKEIQQLLRQVSKDFGDAFIVRFKDGKRIK